MPMKLLSRISTKDAQQKEQTLKVLRAQEVEELAKTVNAKLARAEADFNETLARNRSKWAEEELEHQERIKGMTSEVEALERRKEQALIPISMYKKEADKVMEEAQEFLVKAKAVEEHNNYLQDRLEEKLTDVADRENMVLKEEERQKIALLGIEAQQEATKKGVEELSKQMIMFHEKQQADESSILERKKEVSLAEISFSAKTDKLKRDIEAMRIRERELADERATLDREYARKK